MERCQIDDGFFGKLFEGYKFDDLKHVCFGKLNHGRTDVSFLPPPNSYCDWGFGAVYHKKDPVDEVWRGLKLFLGIRDLESIIIWDFKYHKISTGYLCELVQMIRDERRDHPKLKWIKLCVGDVYWPSLKYEMKVSNHITHYVEEFYDIYGKEIVQMDTQEFLGMKGRKAPVVCCVIN